MIRASLLVLTIVLGLGAQEAPSSAQAPVKAAAAQPAASMPKLDDGLLDPAWFGDGVTFSKDSDIDFYWFKPDLDLTGRTLHFKMWEDPAMLKKDRDGKDNAKATALTDTLPATIRGALTGAFGGKVKVSRSEGDVEVIGRIVDCNAGSRAAKFLIGFGAGQENVTYDIKFVDAKTREVLAAFHNRTISGTHMSHIEDKLVKWADKFGTFVAKKAVK